MITMALMGKIRGMYFRDKKSISEIARLTSLSRNTIKRWLRAAPGTQPKYRGSEVATKQTPFAAALTKALAHNFKRHADRGHRTADASDVRLRPSLLRIEAAERAAKCICTYCYD